MSRRPSCCTLGAAVLTLAVAVPAQHDRLLGRVRDPHGNAVAAVRVRAFSLPDGSVPWREALPAAPIVTRSDDRGRFALALAGRAAVWLDAAGIGAFVAAAAPGVPVLADLAPLATVQLPPDANGAELRLDGVPLGFVAGDRFEVPAGALELLVESDAQPFVAVVRARPGDHLRIDRPAVAPARLLDVAATSVVLLPSWPQRRFVPDAAGVVALPAAGRPSLVRVITLVGDDRCCDEVWLEPGGVHRVAATTPTWQQVRVVDCAARPVVGARVLTIRDGPGEPSVRAVSVTDDDGRARVRTGVERGRIVVEADGFALQALRAIDVEADGLVALAPAHTLRLRIVDEHGVPVPDAAVATGGEPAVRRQVHTDGRGGAVLAQLPAGALAVVVEHADHVPLTASVDVPSSATIELVLAPGLALRGRVVCPDRTTLDDVLLEARRPFDPDCPPRRVAVGADGSFVVRGLSQRAVDLFAWRVDRGVTWSGALVEVAPGGEPVVLTITCDDPQPGGR